MRRRTALAAALAMVWAAGAVAGGSDALERAVASNLARPDILAPAALDSVLAAERSLPVGERVGRWARRYLQAPRTEYRFGLAAGGYVDAGLLVPGTVHDCISFLYRTTELARARDARDAVELALALRFAGASPQEVVGPDGRVDYDHPAHLDYSLDMIRSGRWGRDVTGSFAGTAPDTAGSARYRPGSFRYLPAAALPAASGGLREGDLVWLVLDPRDRRAAALRREHGPVIGHAGVVILEDGVPWLVHAASRPLPPWYDRAGIVGVPLAEYLGRVERYGGLLVTRLGDAARE